MPVFARYLVAVLAASALLSAPAASAKDFKPGDLRVCGVTRCVAIMKPGVLRAVSSFYYARPGQPPTASAPTLGVPTFELRFRGGYVTGIVATAGLDRFLSYGVNLQRFTRGTWYRVPARVVVELKRMRKSLEPLPLTEASPQKSR